MGTGNRVDSLLALLDRSQISTLALAHASHRAILEADGEALGDAGSSEVFAEVAELALRKAVAKANEVVPMMQSKLRSGQRLELFAQVASTIASSTLAATIASDGSKTASLALAAVSLLSTIIGLTAAHRLSGARGEPKGLVDAYSESATMVVEAELLLMLVSSQRRNGVAVDSDTIGRANDLASRLLAAMARGS